MRVPTTASALVEPALFGAEKKRHKWYNDMIWKTGVKPAGTQEKESRFWQERYDMTAAI